MANQNLTILARDVQDTGYLDRLEIQIAATALSIYLNAATTATKKEYVRQVYLQRHDYARQWAAAVRVSGVNITLPTMDDAAIISGVEVVLNAFAPAEPVV
ncbi:MAG: hypothetical protein WBA46_04550 [Thermomicrobiales bacterium]